MTAVPVITVSGVGSGEWVFDDLLGELAYTGHVLRTTIHGLAATSGGVRNDVERAVEALKMALEVADPPIILAHSLGAAVAMAAVEGSQARVRALIALDAGPRWLPERERKSAEQAIDAGVEEILPDGSPNSFAQHVEPWIAEMVSEPEHQSRLLDDMLSIPPQQLRAILSEGRKLQLRIDPRRLHVPVLALAACEVVEECEPACNDLKCRFAGARDASVDCIIPAKHFLMLDQPRAIAEAIRQRLDRVAL